MSYISEININGTSHKIGSTLYGTCATAANKAAKVVTLSDFTKLVPGVTIHVKFTYSNTASDPTLNVNGTGAITIYRYAEVKPGTEIGTSWNAGSVVSFTYDGFVWMMNDWCNMSGFIYSSTEPQAQNYPIGTIWFKPKG